MKNFYVNLCLLGISFGMVAQNVNIPDPVFKAVLLATVEINTDNNKSEISIQEALAYKGQINVCTSAVASIKGIEAFVNITELIVFGNNINDMDLSKNTALTTLDCSSNKLTSLDLTNNTALTSISIPSNQISSIDLSKNLALTQLYCGGNIITNLDLSKNTALKSLYCSTNQISNLDLSNNKLLATISCGKNKLTHLDVSSNKALSELDFQGNQISSINLSQNIILSKLTCKANQLTSLDISKNPLRNLDITSNQIASIDLSKSKSLQYFYGKNNLLERLDLSAISSLIKMECGSNPNLVCIQALNTQSKVGWIKDASQMYSENCATITDIDQGFIDIPKTLLKSYTMDGREVGADYKGFVVYIYSDGSIQKMIKE